MRNDPNASEEHVRSLPQSSVAIDDNDDLSKWHGHFGQQRTTIDGFNDGNEQLVLLTTLLLAAKVQSALLAGSRKHKLLSADATQSAEVFATKTQLFQDSTVHVWNDLRNQPIPKNHRNLEQQTTMDASPMVPRPTVLSAPSIRLNIPRVLCKHTVRFRNWFAIGRY